MTQAAIISIAKPAKALPKRRTTNKATKQAHHQLLAGVAVGAVALTLTGLSLTHLAHGIEIVTSAPSWEAWSMAVGIDCGFVVLEVAQLAVTEKLAREIRKYAAPTIMGTLIGSALLNAFAFGAAATGYIVVPAVALGLAIPAMIYSLTTVATKMYLGRRN